MCIYIYVYSPLISHDRYQNHFYRMGCLCVYVLNISDGGASEFVPLHCIIRIICWSIPFLFTCETTETLSQLADGEKETHWHLLPERNIASAWIPHSWFVPQLRWDKRILLTQCLEKITKEKEHPFDSHLHFDDLAIDHNPGISERIFTENSPANRCSSPYP
jgi:hypothetical protein